MIPLGATEPHNLHLPYGTDALEASIIGDKVCEVAYRRGAKVVLLPTIPYGVQTNMRRLPLAINVNPATLDLFAERHRRLATKFRDREDLAAQQPRRQ